MKPEGRTYNYDWEKIIVDERTFSFTHSVIQYKTSTVKINHKNKSLIYEYQSKNDQKEENRKKEFGKDYYKKMMNIIKGITVKDGTDKPGGAIDGGFEKKLIFMTGGTREYYIYLEEYKSGLEITGKTDELLKFIDDLHKLTKK